MALQTQAKADRGQFTPRPRPTETDFPPETIIVGLKVGPGCVGFQDPDFKGYVVRKGLVCYWSPVLKNFFSGTPGQNFGRIDFDDITEEALIAFFRWIYHDTILEVNGARLHPEVYVDLWLLAYKLSIPELMNDTIQAIEECRAALCSFAIWDGIPIGKANIICRKSHPKSPLRRLLAYYIAHKMKHFALFNYFSSGNLLPPELMENVILFLKQPVDMAQVPDMRPFMVPIPQGPAV